MIDCHFHLWTEDNSTPEKRAERAEQVRRQLEAADVDRVCLIHERGETVEECRQNNRTVAKYVEEYPDLFYGWARANPKWGEAGVREFRRAVEEDGLVGLKLYAQVFLDDERVEPLAEAAVDMDVPIISHVAQRRERIDAKPYESNSDNVVGLAEKFPELKLISGHIGGGGYWEYRIKNLQDYDNVYLDTSGTVTQSGMLEMAADRLGADRLVFGTDTWFLSGVGKLEGVDLTPEQKAEIAYNFEELVGDHVPNKLDPATVAERRERARERFAAGEAPVEATVVDANAFVGHYPFRQVDASPEGLVSLMDRKGVDTAVVSSLSSLLYRNPHRGNHELTEAVSGYEDRLVPVATIDPTYPDWESDLREAVEDLGMAGVKLLPAHHDYDTDDPGVTALLDLCASLDVPVIFAGPLEDQRGRHPRVNLRGFEAPNSSKRWSEEAIDGMVESLQASPQADVIVTNMWPRAGRLSRETTRSYSDGVRLNNLVRDGETLFVLDDMRLFFLHEGEEIVEEVGVDHLACGPRLPFRVFEAHYSNTKHLPVSEAERDRVRSGNVLSLFE